MGSSLFCQENNGKLPDGLEVFLHGCKQLLNISSFSIRNSLIGKSHFSLFSLFISVVPASQVCTSFTTFHDKSAFKIIKLKEGLFIA